MNNKIWASFITDLAAFEPESDDVFNQYQDNNDPSNAVRRANLARYFQHMLMRQASTLMIMEAPGYRGCRITGVPVTSRKILLEGVPEIDLLGENHGYCDAADTGFEAFYGEQSATIVWRTLAEWQRVPVIWNAFPFHPHHIGRPCSNRRPRKSEMLIGQVFLQRVIDAFQPQVVIAVGKVAEETVKALRSDVVSVRHPAQGGKKDFIRGLAAIWNENPV